jgi:hypothetical protein
MGMTTFTSSFLGSCQRREEMRWLESSMAHQRAAFRNNYPIMAFLLSFLNHTSN